MKFIHIADMHFDMPFTFLSKNNLANYRRLEQRNIFRKMINYILENNIEYLFIAGDLYENEYVKKSTIEFINNEFKRIPNTKIFITPGNHDPYLTNSYYNTFKWNSNVYIFNNLNKVELNDINIYGYGFTDFYSNRINIPNNLDLSKINILVMHADLDASAQNYETYNPITKSNLEGSDFNYVALGHIHKSNFDKNSKIIYPGSMIACGFDELDKHGMIIGEINTDTKEITLDLIDLDEMKFIENCIDITEINSQEEIIEKINLISIDKNKYYKIILRGHKKFEINTSEILACVDKQNILKIKDLSNYEYDLIKISKEQSLRGIFVRELLNIINDDNRNDILESIYIGLELM